MTAPDLKFLMVIRQVPEKVIVITYERGERKVEAICAFHDKESFRKNMAGMFETIERDLA